MTINGKPERDPIVLPPKREILRSLSEVRAQLADYENCPDRAELERLQNRLLEKLRVWYPKPSTYTIERVGFVPKLTDRQVRFSSLARAKKAAQTAANVKGGMVGVYDETGKQIAIARDKSDA
jgi:hypothetical protein